MHDSIALSAVRAAQLPRLLLVRDLAEFLDVGEPTVRRYLAEGALPGSRVGRRWVVTRDVLLDHLARGATMVSCADCARPISRAAGVLGESGLVACRACAARLRRPPGGP